eukprot:CAMPEP_0176120456 /NCGR_PEP_ID=MMETSP0120_2-20121206/60592_1 /TAXON_ID=160619 /ORGANISM="Kryptoperidinium foliaceum, Strain CCMP 1326" /LENGTH=184 /DNA_ID=CAMNT_0017454917 /DNA_START=35 /DNA_END=589 /DNA_ORIENTATION=-
MVVQCVGQTEPVPFDPNDGDQDIGIFTTKANCWANKEVTWWRFDGELDWTTCKCSKGTAFKGERFSGFDSSAVGCLRETSNGEIAVIRLYSRTLTCEGDPTYTVSSDDEESKAIIDGDCGALVSSSLGIGYGKLEAAIPIQCKCEELDRMMRQKEAEIAKDMGARAVPKVLVVLAVGCVSWLLS